LDLESGAHAIVGREVHIMRKKWLLIGVALLAAALAIGAVACGEEDEDGEEPTATEAVETPQAGAVTVNLTEWTVAPEPDAIAAGSVTFNAKNIGGEEHDLMIIKTDLAPEALPTKDDGSADDEGEGIEVLHHIHNVAALGGEDSATVDLEPGAYVLICNVVQETASGTVSHYASGMHAAFTVTE
jgi:hypothetical protein